MIYYGNLQGLKGAHLRREVDKWLGKVHLSDRSTNKVRSLSHGMRRRLMVAQAMIGDPELVLLDEPLNGLDPAEVANLRMLFQTRKKGQTLIISSHILTEVEAMCDYIAFVEKGRTIRQDRLEVIRRETTRIEYHVEQGPLPLEKLRKVLPTFTFSCASNETVLTVDYDGEQYTPAMVNVTVLRVLLDNSVGVIQVRRGTDLEALYLNTRSSHGDISGCSKMEP